MFNKIKTFFRKDQQDFRMSYTETTYDGKCLYFAGQCWYVSEEGAREIQIAIESYFLDQQANNYNQAYEDGEAHRVVFLQNGYEIIEIEPDLDDAVRYVRAGATSKYIDLDKCRIECPDGTVYAGMSLRELLVKGA